MYACDGFCGLLQLPSAVRRFQKCGHNICTTCFESPLAGRQFCPNAKCFGRRLLQHIPDSHDRSRYLSQLGQSADLQNFFRSLTASPVQSPQKSSCSPRGDDEEDDESCELIAVKLFIVDVDDHSQQINSRKLRREVGDRWTLAKLFHNLIQDKLFKDPQRKAVMLLKPFGSSNPEEYVPLDPIKDALSTAGKLAKKNGEISIILDFVNTSESREKFKDPQRKAVMLLKPFGSSNPEEYVPLDPIKDALSTAGKLAKKNGELSIVLDFVNTSESREKFTEFYPEAQSPRIDLSAK
uniref:RING-type domain-containing protein n=1 Tax=Steinernema glaseri TaxID=37863 RepID=A0A1I7Z812_9BILA